MVFFSGFDNVEIIDCFSYSDMDYSACTTRGGSYKYFNYYSGTTYSVKDCWTYAATHDYASCETRSDTFAGGSGFTYTKTFYNDETDTDIDCWSYRSGTQSEMYSYC